MKTDMPTQLIIFGITGDLAGRMLIPALYTLAERGYLPDGFRLIGITRRGMTLDELRQTLKARLKEKGMACQDSVLDLLLGNARILKMDLTDTSEYVRLKEDLDAHEDRAGVCMTRLFYLSVPAQSFGHIAKLLHGSGLHAGCPHGNAESRLMVEKPFGYDYESAKELVDDLDEYFGEDRIYRIDHFVAKKEVQRLIGFREQHADIEPHWNGASIKTVTIQALESLDIQGRGDFYEQTGALRDMVQSHLVQLMAVVGMSLPEARDAKSMRKAKAAFLQSVVPIPPDEVSERAVRAQYIGYRDEVNDRRTTTETYAMVALQSDSPRWRDTTFVLHSGKALQLKDTSIRLRDSAGEAGGNELLIHISSPEHMATSGSPAADGGLWEMLGHKLAGIAAEAQADMELEGYERVFYDAMAGDQRLFVSGQEVLAAWRIVEAVLHAWATPHDLPLYTYPKGSAIPAEASALAARYGARA